MGTKSKEKPTNEVTFTAKDIYDIGTHVYCIMFIDERHEKESLRYQGRLPLSYQIFNNADWCVGSPSIPSYAKRHLHHVIGNVYIIDGMVKKVTALLTKPDQELSKGVRDARLVKYDIAAANIVDSPAFDIGFACNITEDMVYESLDVLKKSLFKKLAGIKKESTEFREQRKEDLSKLGFLNKDTKNKKK